MTNLKSYKTEIAAIVLREKLNMKLFSVIEWGIVTEDSGEKKSTPALSMVIRNLIMIIVTRIRVLEQYSKLSLK